MCPGNSEVHGRLNLSNPAETNIERLNLLNEIREELDAHFASLDLAAIQNRNGQGPPGKELIRNIHGSQRAEFLKREGRILTQSRIQHLLSKFAVGRDVIPEEIDPELVPVKTGTESGYLFRLATTLWSIPVSRGYGRRMRYLVIDRRNEKLIGIFALMDPVFNLNVRDEWIGWTVAQRKRRLSSVMDAYVLGAVPPYSQLLGGKLIASLIGTDKVSNDFERKYGHRTGIISKDRKNPRLSLLTVTSALGRSSLYNRVHLPGYVKLFRIGETSGWGHFHIPNRIFHKMRHLLEIDEHKYANGHQFGSGPNWRLRVIRQALKTIGMDEKLLRHGISREVYCMPLASNWREYLTGTTDTAMINRPTVKEMTLAALDRWIIPRARRRPEYCHWSQEQTIALFEPLIHSNA